MRDYFGRPAAVYVIIRNNSKILMLKRVGPWKPGEYVPPSGHVEAQESLRFAAKRELKEEVGLDVEIDDLVFKFAVHRAHNPIDLDDREYLDFYFEATTYTGEPKNMEPDKHSEMIWIDENDLDGYPVVDYTKDALSAIRDNKDYGEFGW